MSSGGDLHLERLHAGHDLSSFDSGNAELDGWLQRHALAAQQMDSACTFLLLEGAGSSSTSASRFNPTSLYIGSEARRLLIRSRGGNRAVEVQLLLADRG